MADTTKPALSELAVPDTWEEHFARLFTRLESRLIYDGVHCRKGTGHVSDPALFDWRGARPSFDKALEQGTGRDPKTIWNPENPWTLPTLPTRYP